MEKKRFIAIRNQADSNTLELYFLDVIADTYDWYMGFTSKVQEIIDKVNYYKPSIIKCIIDSEGGDAQIGMSVYNFLKRCDAKVEVEIIGLAGSIASVIAMAANKGKLRIAKNAFMVIHRAEGGSYGNSEDLRHAADLVDLYTSQIVEIYAQRTGKTVEEINKLIETGDYWMTGEDAVRLGFADQTFNGAENVQIAARVDPKIYKNIPSAIRAQIKPEHEEPNKSFIQQQFDEMKHFFTNIFNAILGVKVTDTAKPSEIVNSIANAVKDPLEKVGDEIETTIKNKVGEVMKGKDVMDAIINQVNDALNGIDLAKDGPIKTAITNAVSSAVSTAVNNAIDPAKNAAFKTIIENAITEATKDLVTNEELEKEINNVKGGKSNPKESDPEVKNIGKFRKAATA